LIGLFNFSILPRLHRPVNSNASFQLQLKNQKVSIDARYLLHLIVSGFILEFITAVMDSLVKYLCNLRENSSKHF
jgi:hypothetical protein